MWWRVATCRPYRPLCPSRRNREKRHLAAFATLHSRGITSVCLQGIQGSSDEHGTLYRGCAAIDHRTSAVSIELESEGPVRILVTGASGSGTTTLGRAIADQNEVSFLDADDYYWLPTNPPFKATRDDESRLEMLLAELRKVSSAVVSGSVMNWGGELENGFSLVVFLTLDPEIRVARIRTRELAARGYCDPEFLEWAAQYDEGRSPGRSRARHEQWLGERTCPVLRIDGDLPVAERLARVTTALSNNSFESDALKTTRALS
jgi:adenylate kinase family enzyme